MVVTPIQTSTSDFNQIESDVPEDQLIQKMAVAFNTYLSSLADIQGETALNTKINLPGSIREVQSSDLDNDNKKICQKFTNNYYIPSSRSCAFILTGITSETPPNKSNDVKESHPTIIIQAGKCGIELDPLKEETWAETIYKHLEVRLDNPEVVTMEEVNDLQALLLSPPINKMTKAKLEDPWHVATAIYHLHNALTALQKGVKPIPTGGGVNGSYYLSNSSGKKLWVFKPEEEEKGDGCAGIAKGQAAKREHVAFLLDYNKACRIPRTLYVEIEIDGVTKKGSIQTFVSESSALSKLYTHIEGGGEEKMQEVKEEQFQLEHIPLEQMQSIALFDIRFYNTDRHGGNILFRASPKGSSEMELVPIDHGGCMTTSLNDPLKMDYLSHIPRIKEVDQKLSDQITNIDIKKDLDIMQAHYIEERAIAWTEAATNVLKKIHSIATFSMFEIGTFFRDYEGFKELVMTKPSKAIEMFEELSKCKAIVEKGKLTKESSATNWFKSLKVLKSDSEKAILHKFIFSKIYPAHEAITENFFDRA